jgi:GrpB-like predicted nucleotidyltransferase (UPF0157 family)
MTQILIADYDPKWPALFALEDDRIRGLLGERALRIEHTGSTSVAGLVAKPIIDVLLVVNDSADEEAYVPDLEAAGYLLRIPEPEWFEHRMFKGPDTDINLHVLSTGCAEIDRILIFRDWQRGNSRDRDLYARTSWPRLSRSGRISKTTQTPRQLLLRRSSHELRISGFSWRATLA